MFGAVAEFMSMQQGDSADFIEKAQALAIGVARDYAPARLYVVRIDNWFGPKWMHFAGKFSVARGCGFGVHKTRLRVPPFVPHRVAAERVFVGPDYEEMLVALPLHIECPSKKALTRLIGDIDKDASFVWFGGESEAQRRGSVMVYIPDAFDTNAHHGTGFTGWGAFYVGFSQREMSWEPVMLRGIARGEVANLEESGRGTVDARLSQGAR